jgi:hypothetical protein
MLYIQSIIMIYLTLAYDFEIQVTVGRPRRPGPPAGGPARSRIVLELELQRLHTGIGPDHFRVNGVYCSARGGDACSPRAAVPMPLGIRRPGPARPGRTPADTAAIASGKVAPPTSAAGTQAGRVGVAPPQPMALVAPPLRAVELRRRRRFGDAHIWNLALYDIMYDIRR